MAKSMRICPRCNSNDIQADLSIDSYARGSYFNRFTCNHCGFAGEFFPEVDITKDIKKAKK